MKEKIHPDYKECKVTCACGNAFVTRSTKAQIHVEICSSCHPFYTGKQKFIDTAGRVEKFQKRHAWDDATMGKVLTKEAPKKNPKRLEKVIVGLPPVKKRKAGEEEGEEGKAEGAKKGEAGTKGEGAKAEGAKKPEGAAKPEGKAPKGGKGGKPAPAAAE